MAKILLVEDNEMNRDMLSRRLARRGYEVVVAVDGEAGVRHVLELPRSEFDLAMALFGCRTVAEITRDLID